MKRKTKQNKKKGANNRGIKQKSLEVITSRLMEISLKVDNYIYKDIPIPQRNAELLKKEVSGYKDKCAGDRRCLQVIEKLERFMKGIIEEQELHACTSVLTDKSEDNANKHNANQTNIITETPTPNIVSNNSENNLSWIENLKYVREISVEETIPVYYQDSFWESHCLPSDWNEEMFQSNGNV